MRYKIIVISILFLSCLSNVFAVSGYNLSIDKAIYFHGDVMQLEITVPDDKAVCAIEVLRGFTVISYIPFAVSAGRVDYLFELSVSDTWAYGDNYTVRIGKGGDFAVANFTLSEKKDVTEIAITNKSEFSNIKTDFAAKKINYTIDRKSVV